MKLPGKVVTGRLQKRYKRFLADFLLDDGQAVTAHCANTGSMKTCLHDQAPSLLSFDPNPKRKLKYSWQALQMPDGWVGINTGIANKLVKEAIENQIITQLNGYQVLKSEQKYGEGSRIDFLLREGSEPDCYVEVKNTTLLLEPEVAGFPDAVTQRGRKHLHELVAMKKAGKRAVLLFCVQRESAKVVRPADAFDPAYGKDLRMAAREGLEVLAYQATFSNDSITLTHEIPVDLS